MSETRLRTAIALFAVMGSALTAYLVYIRYSGAPLACTSGGCETVQRSSYSTLLGVPVAALGLAAYVAIFATSLIERELARASGAGIALAGVAFSSYLLYVQLGLIHSICDWCLASDVVMTALGALTLLRVKLMSHERLSPA